MKEREDRPGDKDETKVSPGDDRVNEVTGPVETRSDIPPNDRPTDGPTKQEADGSKVVQSNKVDSPGDTPIGDELAEGRAKIKILSSKGVFYNPVQEFNRDLSVAAISVFAEETIKKKRLKRPFQCDTKGEDTEETRIELKPGIKYEEGITILEALSATGLRSIRFALEVGGVKQIIANDISQKAVENINRNIEFNGVEHLVETSHSDASLLMYKKKSDGVNFDVIDLDPYGCPSRFLDGAVQCVRDGGILLVTCTDMAVLCGNCPETCYTKYGAVSLHLTACHEMALRIVLQCIESHANRYGRYITPLLSFSADFYVRVIVKINISPSECKKTVSKLSHVYQCVGCKSFELHPLAQIINGEVNDVNDGADMKRKKKRNSNDNKRKLPRVVLSRSFQQNKCEHCNHKMLMGGPIWSAPTNCPSFIQRILKIVSSDISDKVCPGGFSTWRRMQGMLSLLSDELLNVPLYYTISSLCVRVHCSTIPLIDFRSALLNAGFRVSLSHAAPNSLKTDAPGRVIWDVVRAWIKNHPISEKRLTDHQSVTSVILSTQPSSSIDFTRHPDSYMNMDILKYQPNPQPNWGPGTRAHTKVDHNECNTKSKARQNRKSTKAPDLDIDGADATT